MRDAIASGAVGGCKAAVDLGVMPGSVDEDPYAFARHARYFSKRHTLTSSRRRTWSIGAIEGPFLSEVSE